MPSHVPAGGFRLDVWPPAERIHNDWETLGRLKEFWFLFFSVPDCWEYSGYVARPGKSCLPVTLRQTFLHSTTAFRLISVGAEPRHNAYW